MEKLIEFLTIWSDWSIKSGVEDAYWMNGIALIVGFVVSCFVVGVYIFNVMPGMYPAALGPKSWLIPIFGQLFLLWIFIQIPGFWSWIIGITVEVLWGYFLNGSGIYEAWLDKCRDKIRHKEKIEAYKEIYNNYLTA